MNKNILFVDDEYDVLSSYQRNFRRDFNVKIATGAIEALEILKDNEEFAIVVSDYRMPQMNGIDLLDNINKLYPDTIRIIITGYADLQIAIDAVNKGNIFRFLTKPCPVQELKKVLDDSIELYRLKKSEKQLLNNTLKGIISLLLEMQTQLQPSLVDEYKNLRYLSHQIIAKLNIKVNWEFDITLMMSKLGYIIMPQELIEKKMNSQLLKEDEIDLLETFPVTGAELIKKIPRMEGIANAIRYQNLNYDGSNFPDVGISGNEIPLASRMLKLLNDYSHYISQGYSQGQAIIYFQDYSKIKYDPLLLSKLQIVLQGEKNSNVVRSIKFRELRIGMYLAKEIKDSNGNTLVKKGAEITDLIILKLIQTSKVRHIVEPIIVIEETNL